MAWGCLICQNAGAGLRLLRLKLVRWHVVWPKMATFSSKTRAPKQIPNLPEAGKRAAFISKAKDDTNFFIGICRLLLQGNKKLPWIIPHKIGTRSPLKRNM